MSDTSLTPVEQLIKIVSSYCRIKEIPYVIVGGIAVLFWGRPRTTQDVDIIIDHSKLDIADFVDYLKDNNVQCSKDDLQQAFENKQHSNVNFYKNTVFRLDIKGIYSEHEKLAVEERYKQHWKGLVIYIDDIHNLIINKLRFGSQQDQEDALATLLRNIEKIDVKKLKQRAKDNEVSQELEYLFEKADLDL